MDIREQAPNHAKFVAVRGPVREDFVMGDAYFNLLHRIAARRRTLRRLELMQDALELIRDHAGEELGGGLEGIKDHGWCAGVAMSALAAVEEVE